MIALVDEQPLVFAPSAWRTLPAFAGYEPWLERLAAHVAWPDVTGYRAILDADVDFVESDPRRGKLKAGLDASDIEGSYVARCRDGVVPTRLHNLHDLMGALTWARFPQTKRAIIDRQISVAVARGAVTNRLRTKEQDTLAMLDEGGVFIIDGASITFGHGLLEDAVRGRVSRGIPVRARSDDDADLAAALIAHAVESAGRSSSVAGSAGDGGH